jgi:hypothetical protein
LCLLFLYFGGYINGVGANLVESSVVLSEIWLDGADEVRDESHSLVNIQLILFYMDLRSVGAALLCPKCKQNTRKYQYLNLIIPQLYAPSAVQFN